MSSILVLFVCGVVLVSAGIVHEVEEHHDEHHDDHHDEHAPANYNFQYKIHEPHTGDIKSQHETRIGNQVKGYYTIKESDGTLREIHYAADHHNGFKALAKRLGQAHGNPIAHGPLLHSQSQSN